MPIPSPPPRTPSPPRGRRILGRDAWRREGSPSADDQGHVGARHLERFEALATASKDPWFLLLAAQERSIVDGMAGHFTRAHRTLLDARRLCEGPGLEYRCISLERELSGVYIQMHQLDAARTHAERGWRQARTTNEWMLEGSLLWNLATIARFVKDAPLARACLEELLERDRDLPDMVRRVRQHLADLALQAFRVDEARRELDAALATGLPLSLSGAFTLVDLSRLKVAPEDETHLTRSLEAVRPGLASGERVLATHVLGRFYLEHEAEKGRALLWRSIEEADAPGLAEDADARRARAYSFTSLILDAGRRGAFEEALELFSRERGQRLPGQCLLAATADSERTLIIARGPTGELLGHHDDSRRQPLPERLDGLVPEKLLAPLRACPKVEVLARPPLHGRAGLLPPELAWSYLTRTSEPRSSRTGSAVHLVVSDVELPPDVALKRLNSWSPAFGPDEQRLTLSGAEATPSRVLAAMRNATEVDLVAHGTVSDSSQASYLLLAPERDGSELGVSRVRTASLQGAPFVVLAACHAAQTAYVLHERFSLPAAFIEAGARGVLAATVEIPDLEAGAFFNAIRERMRAGTPPAVALRDERVRWRREGRGAAWLDNVLLFE